MTGKLSDDHYRFDQDQAGALCGVCGWRVCLSIPLDLLAQRKLEDRTAGWTKRSSKPCAWNQGDERASRRRCGLLSPVPTPSRSFTASSASGVTRRRRQAPWPGCSSLRLLDDRDYALRFSATCGTWGVARSRRYAASCGKRELPRSTSKKRLRSLRSRDIPARIAGILEKRYRTTLGVEKGRRRAIKALQRLGYAYGDIREALREFPMQESEEYEIGEVE